MIQKKESKPQQCPVSENHLNQCGLMISATDGASKGNCYCTVFTRKSLLLINSVKTFEIKMQ